ncbi:MAG: sigma 54-interacting transcriptional regulator [Myxococcota bacterium]
MYTCDSELALRSEAVFERVAGMQQSNLLLSGPTGAGKTWMAKRIAADVFGANGLVEVVLRPGPTEMLVSQLWGTRVGDFTGAVARKGAIFEAWNKGAVLFLDELQNLDEVGQRVLLPLLELPNRRFGSLTSGVADLERPLHIILGTNARLDDNGWSGTFREDLWWRISPVRIDLPPLSKRGREAVYRHLEDLLRQLGLPAPEDVFERGALQQLATHTWPGNLRSLADLAERAAIRYRTQMQRIPASGLEALGLQRGSPDRMQTAPTPSSAPLASAQARTVLEVLGRHDYVQATAAEELGISKFALHRLLKRLDLIDHVRDRRNAMRK